MVTKNIPLEKGIIAINCFGFGGANAHVVIDPHTKPKTNLKKPKHRLVIASGRTYEAVEHFLDNVLKNQDDQDFLALIDEIHKNNIDGHGYRG